MMILKFNEVAAAMVDRWCRTVFICVASVFFLFNHTSEQQFSVSGQERMSLLQLRSSLGLRAKEWPVKSDPCASWRGIQCTNGRVTGINVTGFRRTKTASEKPRLAVYALQSFTGLTSFSASNFPLPGPIPDWFGSQLPALRVLDLRSCLISGALPPTLGNLSSLVELYLSGNNLTGEIPSSLGQLVGLTALDLSRNMLTGSIPTAFAALRNLTSLDMSLNFMSGDIPPDFGNLSSLQFLNLSGNSFSSSIPAQLAGLSSLVELDLAFNTLSGSLSDDLFSALTRLQLMVLSHNEFSGDFPNVLWSAPSLQFLDVSENNFTGQLPNFSSTSNATVPVINISHNFFYGNLMPAIRRFGFIDLSGNYFVGPVPIYTLANTSLDGNCLRNAYKQRENTDCESFYADRNLTFVKYGNPNVTQSPTDPDNTRSHKSIIILASVIGGVVFIAVLIMIIVVVIVCKKRKRGTIEEVSATNAPLVPDTENPPPVRALLNFSNLGLEFTYQQILQATGEFNDANLIRRGHSGDIFYGKLESGMPVIIKRINLSLSEKMEMCTMELEIFSKVSHPRLVPLLGHCLENENEKFLVYKHMPNGDLSTSLFKKAKSDDDSLQSLDWITRLKIATGAAEGLSYFHHECNPPLVHRDVKASSILLDDKYEVRLGSLSEVCSQEGAIHQNMITRLLRFPQISDQSASDSTINATCPYDVYCFGKVLLELVTGNLGISSSNDASTKEWLESILPQISINDKELVTSIIDPSLILHEDLLEEVWAVAIVAMTCLNPKPVRRPVMHNVLKALENPLMVVREEQAAPSRSKTASSSRWSWNTAVFGSWRRSSSDVGARSAGSGRKAEGGISGGNSNGRSASMGRYSKDIFPEPLKEQDVERESEGQSGGIS